MSSQDVFESQDELEDLELSEESLFSFEESSDRFLFLLETTKRPSMF